MSVIATNIYKFVLPIFGIIGIIKKPLPLNLSDFTQSKVMKDDYWNKIPDSDFRIDFYDKLNNDKTENKGDIIKLKDLFSNFKESDYYHNLTKNDKRKYNYSFFDNYFSTNIFFKKY